MKASIQRIVRMAAAGVEGAGLLTLLERLGDTENGLLRVLAYHRVDEPDADSGLHPGLLSATPTGFEQQMRLLADRYQVVALDDLLRATRGESTLPRRAVLITFDDAYDDFTTHAWPVLTRLGLPATLFVPTAYPDRPDLEFWWDRLYRALAGCAAPRIDTELGALQLDSEQALRTSFDRLRGWLKTLPHQEAMSRLDLLFDCLGPVPPGSRVLGWDTLRALHSEGLSLAPHTRTHPLLDRLPSSQVHEEVQGSLDDLRREIGSVPPVLAYPAGGYDDRVMRVLPETGIELALTTNPGLHRLGAGSPLAIPRFCVSLAYSSAALRARLAVAGPVRRAA